jgi:hypothetical protein
MDRKNFVSHSSLMMLSSLDAPDLPPGRSLFVELSAMACTVIRPAPGRADGKLFAPGVPQVLLSKAGE